MGVTRSGRNRLWASWSSGSSATSLAAASEVRVYMLSLVEMQTVLDRKVQEYTVVRTIGQVSLRVASGETVVTVGIAILDRDVALGTITPGLDTHADWLYHRELITGSTIFERQNELDIDVRGQRKSRGSRTELYMKLSNRGAVAVLWHTSGRVLLLEN